MAYTVFFAYNPTCKLLGTITRISLYHQARWTKCTHELNRAHRNTSSKGKARGGKGRSTWSNLRSREHIRATVRAPLSSINTQRGVFPYRTCRGGSGSQAQATYATSTRAPAAGTSNLPVHGRGRPALCVAVHASGGWVDGKRRTNPARRDSVHQPCTARSYGLVVHAPLAGTELSGPRPRESILLDAISSSMEDRISRLNHARGTTA